MTDFEFLFALFSLLLGLSLAAILSGFGRAIEHEFATETKDKSFTIGWLSPLLAIFMILDLLSFWAFGWVIREQLTVSASALLAVTSFACAYYLAARLVFPSNPSQFENLDNHYFRVRRVVIAILAALVIAQWLYILSVPKLAEAVISPTAIALTAGLLILMAVTAWTSRPWLSGALLAILGLRYLLLYLV